MPVTFISPAPTVDRKKVTMLAASATAKIWRFIEVSGARYTSSRGLVEAFVSWRRRRTQKDELHGLSDAALKDIGVSRWEIDGIVDSPNRDASGRVR
jgi:uncharacterized protein YjiS (DUF1127 family)